MGLKSKKQKNIKKDKSKKVAEKGGKNNHCNNKNNNNNNNKTSKKKKKQQSKQEYEKFKEQLNSLNLRINEVGGDGNCLFRSICDQLEGSETNHEYYRELACEYIEENKDFLKFFIEDDKSFEDYVTSMRKSGTWGGNLELYSLSMSLNVNFYIFLLDRPLYIVKNHDVPKRNIFLSYHNGEHYNSVRMKDDFISDDTPVEIPMSLLTGVDQTQNSQALNDISEENYNDNDSVSYEDNDENSNESIDKNEEVKGINKEHDEDEDKEKEINNNDLKKNKNKNSTSENIVNNKQKDEVSVNYKDIMIKDISYMKNDINNIDENSNNHKYNTRSKTNSKVKLTTENKILSIDGVLYEEVKRKKQIKYENQKIFDENIDIIGEYGSNNVFYCDINSFYNKFSEELSKSKNKEKCKNKDNSDTKDKEVESLTKKIELIYI